MARTFTTLGGVAGELRLYNHRGKVELDLGSVFSETFAEGRAGSSGSGIHAAVGRAVALAAQQLILQRTAGGRGGRPFTSLPGFHGSERQMQQAAAMLGTQNVARTGQRFAPYSTRPIGVPLSRDGSPRASSREPSGTRRSAYEQIMQRAAGAYPSRETSGARGGRAGRGWIDVPGGYAELKTITHGDATPNLAFTGTMLSEMRVRSRITYHPTGSKIESRFYQSSNARSPLAEIELTVGFSTQRSLRIAMWQHFGTRPTRRRRGIPPRRFAYLSDADRVALSSVAANLYADPSQIRQFGRGVMQGESGRFFAFGGYGI